MLGLGKLGDRTGGPGACPWVLVRNLPNPNLQIYTKNIKFKFIFLKYLKTTFNPEIEKNLVL